MLGTSVWRCGLSQSGQAAGSICRLKWQRGLSPGSPCHTWTRGKLLQRFNLNMAAPSRAYKESVQVDSSPNVRVVDMRSDTLTKPTAAMRQAMAQAKVGDDVFGEDPTINAFQKQVAALFGMEAALFVPTGTMGNCISVLAHCSDRGQEVLVGDRCHIYRYEQGGISQLGGVHSRSLKNLPDGTFDLEELRESIRPLDDHHQPHTRVICIENTHNICGGTVLPVEFLQKVREIADENQLKVHMDGARLMNAAVAMGKRLAEILKYADSVSLCFSKGLGAPVGSVVGGSTDFIARCVRLRKVFGGGMRQAGVLAAAGQVALMDAEERLRKDHQHAQQIAQALNEHGEGVVRVDLDLVHTNIIMTHIIKEGLDAKKFSERLAQVTDQEVSDTGDHIAVCSVAFQTYLSRFVTHSDLSAEDIDLAVRKIKYVLKEYGSL